MSFFLCVPSAVISLFPVLSLCAFLCFFPLLISVFRSCFVTSVRRSLLLSLCVCVFFLSVVLSFFVSLCLSFLWCVFFRPGLPFLLSFRVVLLSCFLSIFRSVLNLSSCSFVLFVLFLYRSFLCSFLLSFFLSLFLPFFVSFFLSVFLLCFFLSFFLFLFLSFALSLFGYVCLSSGLPSFLSFFPSSFVSSLLTSCLPEQNKKYGETNQKMRRNNTTPVDVRSSEVWSEFLTSPRRFKLRTFSSLVHFRGTECGAHELLVTPAILADGPSWLQAGLCGSGARRFA